MENLKLLSDLGIDHNVMSQYQILCFPEDIENRTETNQLADSGESITLSKLLKEEGVKCANSYDLGLDAKISERRGVDLWLGSIWILKKAVFPLFIAVAGRLIGEKIQRKLDTAQELQTSQRDENFEETKVHADLKIIDGKLNAEIKYNGDADTFLKVLKGINHEQ